MGQFVYIICNSSYWYYTEASWPFISKVVASGCNFGHKPVSETKLTNLSFFLVHKLVSKQKLTDLSFVFMIVIKYIARLFIWVNLFILHLIHSIGIIQRLRDNLFQKSWHLDATCVINWYGGKIDKFEGFSLWL